MPVMSHSVSVVLLLLDVPVSNFRDALCLPTSPKQGIRFSQAADCQAYDSWQTGKTSGAVLRGSGSHSEVPVAGASCSSLVIKD